MSRWKFIGVVLIIFAGVWFVWPLLQGEEGRIRAQLEKLEELVSFPAGEGNLQAAAKAKRLSGLFTENASLDFNAAGRNISQSGGRKAVMQAAMAVRNQASALEAKLYDVTVEIAPDKSTAEAKATGRARIPEQESSAVEDFVFTFVKTDEGWLIDRIENAQTFR